MHGSYFPEITLEEILSWYAFILLVLSLVLFLVLLRRLLPGLIPVSLLKGGIVAGGMLILWEAVSALGLVNPVLLPSPARVFSNIVYMWSIGFLQPQIASTLFRLAYAFSLALLSAVPLGVLVSYFPGYFAPVESLANAVRVVPAPAWLSLSILWFGIGHASAVFIIWLGCFFPIFLNTVTGVSKADPAQVETVLTFGGDRLDVLIEVILPVSYHHILTGARIGLGIGWITLVTAELASVDIGSGLGWMIQDSRILLDTTTVLSGIILVGVFGMLTDSLLRKFDGLVQGWS